MTSLFSRFSQNHSIIIFLVFTLVFLTECAKEVDPAQSMVEITYNIPEMHCDGCVRSISTALNQLEGIDSVQVSLENFQAFVRVDTVISSNAEIKQTIKGLGYSAARQ